MTQVSKIVYNKNVSFCKSCTRNIKLPAFFNIFLEKLGPSVDHDGMRIFYFMDIWAQDDQLDKEGSWLQSALIDGKEHEFGCFSFWFTFKVGFYIAINFIQHLF